MANRATNIKWGLQRETGDLYSIKRGRGDNTIVVTPNSPFWRLLQLNKPSNELESPLQCCRPTQANPGVLVVNLYLGISNLKWSLNHIQAIRSSFNNHSSNLAAASNLLTIMPLHFSAFVKLPSSKLSTRPGYVAPAYPVHLPGAKTTCLNQGLSSSPSE
jgi:hypothetical protein